MTADARAARVPAAASGVRSVSAVALAIAAGLALWAAQPPVSVGPLAFLVVPALLGSVWVAPTTDRPTIVALGLGLLAGLVGYLPMLVWLVLPAGVLAWVLLSAIQALYMAAFAALVRPWLRHGAIVAVAPLLWTGLDAWRALVPLSGFGWGALAYAHVDSSWLLPLARIGGQHLLTLATVLVGTLAFDGVRRALHDEPSLLPPDTGIEDRLRAARPALLGLTASLALIALVTIEPPPPRGTLDVLVAQGNDLLSTRRAPADVDRQITRNLADLTLASATAAGPPELTVWPESSVDRDPFTARGSDLRPALAEAAAAPGGLLVGANLEGPRPSTFLNTALLLDDDAEVVDRYVKRRLVPFGEFVPWRSVLGDLPPLRRIARDGVPGDGPHAVSLDGTVDVAVAICFESLFPGLLRDNVVAGDGAELVVIITNDASFGVSSEPAQHLDQARLRAVETGRWVVYGALSGRSAFVDPEGGIHDLTGLFTLESIRREVPLVEGQTPFLTTGDLVGKGARVLAVGFVSWAGVARLIRRRERPPEAP